jgi:hypothetical protein
MSFEHEVTKERLCHVCQKPDWCRYSQDGSGMCRRVSGGTEMTDSNGEAYWIHGSTSSLGNTLPRYTAPALAQRASCEVVDKIYRFLLALLELSEGHRKDLLDRRKFTTEDVSSFGFKSVSARQSPTWAKAVAERFPEHWLSVPGFFLKDGRPALAVTDGLLIPCLDPQGQICALKLRRDECKGGSRYFYLSSSKHGGPTSGSPITFWGFSRSTEHTVRITEGELKAGLAFSVTQTPTLSVPGIGQLTSPSLIQALTNLGCQKVLLAPDADALTNWHVSRSVRAGIKGICEAGFEVAIETWPTEHKGIDDALAANIKVKLVSPSLYLDTLPQEPKRASEEDKKSEIPLLEQVLILLGANCDGAQGKDGVGFNSNDAEWFESHVETAKAGKRIPFSARAACRKKLTKYQKQTFAAGINLNDVTDQEADLRKELKEEAKVAANEDKEPSQSSKLLEISESWELFQFQGTPYASFLIENKDQDGKGLGTYRRETHRFSRGGVRAQLLYAFLQEEGHTPTADALGQVVPALEAKAMFEGKERPVFLRCGHQEGRYYVDLCDGQGTVAEISETGWRLTNDPPIRFFRNKSMAALPVPVDGGSLDALRQLLGFSESSWRLVVSWLVYSLTPLGPFPVLLLEGSAGASKSTTVTMIRNLVDPNAHPLRGKPKDVETLAVQAGNNWVLALDNLDTVTAGISDLICCLATGGSFAARQMYSNDEEAVISYRRPVILSGIGGMVGRPDLGDRLVKITLPAMTDDRRLLESEVLSIFDSLKAETLGCLLTAVSAGLRNSGKVKLPPLPRMADFAAFIVQAEEALPWSTGGFIEAFNEHRSEQVETALDGDPLAAAVRTLVQINGSWRGSPSDLSERLHKFFTSTDDKGLLSPRKLGPRLRVLQGYLSQVGVQVIEGRSNGARFLELRKTEKSPPTELARNLSSLSALFPQNADAKGVSSVPMPVPINSNIGTIGTDGLVSSADNFEQCRYQNTIGTAIGTERSQLNKGFSLQSADSADNFPSSTGQGETKAFYTDDNDGLMYFS